jgi:uncharacterized protein
MRRLLPLLVIPALALSGCGATDDAERIAQDARDRVEEFAASEQGELIKKKAEELRADAERVTKRVRERVEKALEDLEKAVPAAPPTAQPPTIGERADASEIDKYLTEIITDVDKYWTETLTASGRNEPRVSYRWIPPGESVRTGCDFVADDNAALYCSGDDTIYVAARFATQLAEGASGEAVGDFGVAYVVAHEYAHNVQTELGFFDGGINQSVKPFELQADCMAGLWANSVYREGRLEPGDVEEAMQTAQNVGDFEFLSPQHHGTPRERRNAWLAGYRTGDPSSCRLGSA